MITINKMEEMQKYYDANSDTYVFDDHVTFNCNISAHASIIAHDIDARNIKTRNIKAHNINVIDMIANDIVAWNIKAYNIEAQNIMAEDISAADINAYNITAHAISYYAVCFAYENITCTSIKGRRPNCRHFVLDGEIKEEKK